LGGVGVGDEPGQPRVAVAQPQQLHVQRPRCQRRQLGSGSAGDGSTRGLRSSPQTYSEANSNL